MVSVTNVSSSSSSIKVYIKTYGCTLNQADSDIIRAIISESGRYVLVDCEGDADVVVLNTCTVKGATDNKIISKIRLLRAQGRRFVVSGCLTVNAQKIRKFAPEAPILGTSALKHICSAIDDALARRPTVYGAYESKEALPKQFGPPGMPIIRIPINEGCVSRCAFCQTKLARPFLRSYSPKTIIKWMNEGIKQGAREIQLTSMDAGAYGIDIKTNLVSLLETIISDNDSSKPVAGSCEGTSRDCDESCDFLIRLGMINPDHAKRMLPGLITALSNFKFYKFLHIPVQTGSEKVCQEMDRDHTVKDFVDIVHAVRKEFSEAMIATDIIVGYPTETEDDFEATKRLLQNTKPETVNLSKFSSRPGTKAKTLKQLPNDVIKQRSTELSVLIKQIALERRKALIGRKYRVLVTEKQRDFTGRNINYQQVVVQGFTRGLGDFIDVKIVDANHGSLFAEL